MGSWGNFRVHKCGVVHGRGRLAFVVPSVTANAAKRPQK